MTQQTETPEAPDAPTLAAHLNAVFVALDALQGCLYNVVTV